jgi:3'-phosphoadenosine 5'-phosphosulfate sulfotransferase (PAPS reductase)/FAD synthetase
MFKITEPTVVSFSGGRTSAYMLWRVLQENNGLPKETYVCFANTGKEDPSTLRFVKACEDNWKVKIYWLEFIPENPKFKEVNFETASRDGKPFSDLITKRNYLPNPVARFCTSELKVLTIDRFMKSKGIDEYETMVGIRADEQRRAAKMKDGKITPLVKAGTTQEDVQKFWLTHNFDLALEFRDGVTPLGNCDLCYLKGAKQIQSIIGMDPDRATWWAKQERKIGGTFRNDRPSYTEMQKFSKEQTDMFNSDGSISCFCGD